jgi:NTE family protein
MAPMSTVSRSTRNGVDVELDLRDDGTATKRPKTAFVLGGGGNLGAVQVGMLQALLDRGIVPDVVVGCSVGSLNGAAIAGNPTSEGAEHLGNVWSALDGTDIFSGSNLSSIWSLVRRGPSLSTNEGLRRLLRDASPITSFEEAVVPLHVVATSLATGDERWFTSGSIVDPILASAALPAVFPPIAIDGELHVDGAVVNNVPISRAAAVGAERVYVCHVGNFSRPRSDPKRPIDVLLQSFSIARNHRFQSEATRRWPDIELIVLPGVDPGKLGRNDFRRTGELIRRGRESAGDFLDRADATSAALRT